MASHLQTSQYWSHLSNTLNFWIVPPAPPPIFIWRDFIPYLIAAQTKWTEGQGWLDSFLYPPHFCVFTKIKTNKETKN